VGKKNAAGTGFIDNGAGWEGVSLPFTAEIVTTNTKGEITHFYGSRNKGHEYWLRKFEGGALKSGSTDVFEATFNRPAEGTVDKTYTNTFLWDYYYSYNNYDDMNSDKYQEGDKTPQTYYKPGETKDENNNPIVNTFTNYPRLSCATPYIIGFPGERYYEFDLSGNFEAKTAAITPGKLSAQVITFASAPQETIHVSDLRLESGKQKPSNSDYTFVPNFASKTLASAAYILNTNDTDVDQRGNSYKIVTSNAETVPFRPYFIGAPNLVREGTRSIGQTVRTIIFSDEQTQLEGEDEAPKDKEIGGTLNIYAKRKKIVVSSTLSYTADLRVVTPAGITVSTFSVKPGETVEVRADFSGMYIVHTLDGQYMKKVAIKRE